MLPIPGLGAIPEAPQLDGLDLPLPPVDEFFPAEEFEDVPFQRVEPAIALSGRDLERFVFRFDAALQNARVRMRPLHEEAKRDREVYKMLAREAAYEGGPDITTPLAANKADGVYAMMREAIEQRPLASFTAEGLGEAVAYATAVAPVLEAVLEREINRSGSREKLSGDLAREAVQVGTGIGKLTMASYPNETFTQISEVIRLENFYVDRVFVDSLKDTFCAYEKKERVYNLEDMAERGLLDEAAVAAVRAHASGGEPLIAEEAELHWHDSFSFEEENGIRTLVIGYMRYRPQGERRSKLWECIWHEDSRTVLALRENPVRRAFDAPPLCLQRIGKQTGYLFGRGVVRRLEPEQKMADNAINNHLAMSNLAASPPFLYRQSGPFGRALESYGRGGMVPGMGIPTLGAPKDDEVKPLAFPYTGLELNNVQVAFDFSDRATFSEEALGTATDSRKTLGQFQIEVQKGTMRLRVDLGDFAYDAATTLRQYWAMTVAYKIAPAGVVELDENGKLVALDDIGPEELESEIIAALYPLMARRELSAEDAAEIEKAYGAKLTEDHIPGVRRNDLTLSLTGTKIIADKIGELNMLMQLTPLITGLLPAAAQDSYINYHLRSIITSMGFADVNKRMPPDPGRLIEDPQKRQLAVQQMHELLAKSARI